MGGSSKPKQQVDLYYMSIHMAICHGPVDRLTRIVTDEKDAWTGVKTVQGDIDIDKQNLFGGKKREGGVDGIVHYLPGVSTQTIPEEIAAKHGKTTATMPAYRGITSLFFHKGRDKNGFYWRANSPYLPDVWATVGRASVGLNLSYARLWRGAASDVAVYMALDTSGSMAGTRLTNMKAAVVGLLTDLRNDGATGLDFRLVSWSSSIKTSIERRNITTSGYDDLISWVNGLTTSGGTDFNVAVSQAAAFFSGSGTKQRVIAFVTDGEPSPSSSASAAVTTLSGISNVSVYGFNIDLSNTTYTAMLDNTSTDGVPVVSGGNPQALQNSLAAAFGKWFDSNPAHIIYECLTNREWGMGAASTAIDVAAFEAAALTLFTENFGLSLIWTRQSKVESFIGEILDHIEATLFVNPQTGLLTLKLIRDDYDVNTLPVFGPDNCVITNFQRKFFGETINEIVVTYTNPDKEEDETVIAQDNANIEVQGGIVSDGRNYYGVRLRSTAVWLANRDLRSASAPLASCEIEADRSGWNLLPGGVLKLQSPEDDGIAEIIMRVGPVDYGKPGSSKVKVTLVEDVFALPLAEYVEPPTSGWTDTSEDPAPAAYSYVFTLPYFTVIYEVDPNARSGFAYPIVFAGVLAAQTGQDTQSFELLGKSVDAAGNAVTIELGTMTIASRAELEVALAAEAQTTVLSFPNRTQGRGPQIGGFVLIGNAAESGVELALITAYSASGYALNRGVLDTVPRAWPIGTPVWFLDENLTFTDDVQRSEGETVEYKILTETSKGLLDESGAPWISTTLTGRPWLPSRPADVKVNSVGFGVADASGLLEIPTTWANRNRLTEDSQVLSWTAATVTPETGQTTVIEVLAPDMSLLTTHSGLTGATFNVPVSSFGSNSWGYIKVESDRDGLRSLQGHTIETIVSSDILLLDGEPLTVDGEVLIMGA